MFRSPAVPIANFLGLNRRDGADLVANNEFYTLQNVYPKTKGLFYKREGSVEELADSEFIGGGSVLGIHRHTNVFGEKETFYYVKPDSGVAYIATPTTPGVLTNIVGGGDIFNGGAAGTLDVRYSWVGRGFETDAVGGATILPSASNSTVRITVPAFPSGVRSANVFILRPAAVSFSYVGTIYTSGGSLDIKCYVAGIAASGDALGSWITDFAGDEFGSGSLKAGTYYLSAAWVADGNAVNAASATPTVAPFTNQYIKITVPADNMSIRVGMYLAAGASTNGATHVYYFIGTKPPTEAPLLFAGIKKIRTATTTDETQPEILEITAMPSQTNVATYAKTAAARTVTFSNGTMSGMLASITAPVTSLYKKGDSGTLKEVFLSRSSVPYAVNGGGAYSPFTGTGYLNSNDERKFVLDGGATRVSMTSFLGEVWMANGINLLHRTDGFTISELVEKVGTTQPGYADSVFTFKNQLVMTVTNSLRRGTGASSTQNMNQVFGSQVYAPDNWADGGTGSLLRFATVGDGFADGVAALGLFNFNSATDGPNAFLACFKKASTWMLTNIPDSTSGVYASATAISGRVGCVAPGSVVSTNIGLMFLGSDGDVYLLSSGGGEPRRVGNRIRPMLEHLAQDEDLMRRCTATFHRGFYKLSYPSSSASTTNDAQLWADLRTEQGSPITWCGPHTGISVGPQIVFVGEGDEDTRLCVIDNTCQTAYLDDTSTYQDLGTTISSVIEWKTSRMQGMSNLKRYIGMLFDLYYDTQYAHTITVEGFADDQYTQQEVILSQGTGVWDSSSYDSGNWGDARFFGVPTMFGPDNLLGRTFKWRLTHANNAQMITAGANIIFQPERRLVS